LKTAGFGYDGKGQTKIESAADIETAFAALNESEAVLEKFVAFDREVSVVCARDRQGNFADYGVIENARAAYSRRFFRARARFGKNAAEAVEIARAVAEKFDYVGTLCVEFFLTEDEKLLINELAPRPHNSGHLTFDACVTSQFEQQLRAVCGLPLGSTEFYAVRDGESFGRFVVKRRTGLGASLKISRAETASLRQSRSARRAKNGTFDGAGENHARSR
jgi:5-(carboxyamino)imidazole ribonucleotide synthase